MYISRKTQLILTNYQKELIDEMIYVRRNIWNKLIETYNPIIIQNLENKKDLFYQIKQSLINFLKD